jgi:hypothetical protein
MMMWTRYIIKELDSFCPKRVPYGNWRYLQPPNNPVHWFMYSCKNGKCMLPWKSMRLARHLQMLVFPLPAYMLWMLCYRIPLIAFFKTRFSCFCLNSVHGLAARCCHGFAFCCLPTKLTIVPVVVSCILQLFRYFVNMWMSLVLTDFLLNV